MSSERGSTRRVWLAVALACVGAALVAIALPRAAQRGPVSVNADAGGFRAAWLYLQARGWPVREWRQPLADLPLSDGGVLVLSVPGGAPYGRTDADMVRRWLMVGGDVLVFLDPTRDPDGPLLEELDVEVRQSARTGSTDDLMETLAGETTLEPGPDADWTADGPVLVRAGPWGVQPDPDEARLAVDDRGELAIRERRLHQGRVVIVSDQALMANAWFAREGTGNAVVLEALLSRLDADRGVLLDEYHWGLREVVDDATVAANRRGLDLLLFHLLLVYVLVAWTLGRRFGPGRPPAPPPRTSVERDLAALGALHARARHRAELGQLLLDAVDRTSSPAARAVSGLPDRFDGTDADLVALARKVGELQRDGRL